MDDYSEVGSYVVRLQAEIARSMLAAHGIRSRIVADDAGGMYPFPMSPHIGIRLLVLRRDRVRALALLGEKG